MGEKVKTQAFTRGFGSPPSVELSIFTYAHSMRRMDVPMSHSMSQPSNLQWQGLGFRPTSHSIPHSSNLQCASTRVGYASAFAAVYGQILAIVQH